MTKDELKEVIKEFVDRCENTQNLNWTDLLPKNDSYYKEFKVNISYGKGSRVKWPNNPIIAFLKDGHIIKKGI